MDYIERMDSLKEEKNVFRYLQFASLNLGLC
jgi:hypothetical protein